MIDNAVADLIVLADDKRMRGGGGKISLPSSTAPKMIDNAVAD